MIIAASMEFEKGHNNEVQERPSDNSEIPVVCQFQLIENRGYLLSQSIF